LGKNIKSITLEKSIGLKTIPLDLAKMASGEYILVFKNNAVVIEKRLIKM
jgi:hypothetical protein